jgi:hypothetical protein
LGKTENDGAGDPWPITVPGESKPIRSDRVEDYVNADFWFYYNFYNNCKHAGPPYSCAWPDWPPWVVQMIALFDTILDREKRNNDARFHASIHGYKVG